MSTLNILISSIQLLETQKSYGVISIFNEKVRVKLDTSAEVNVMLNRVYQKLVTDKRVPKDGEIKTTSTKLTRYGGLEIPVKGSCTLPCSYKWQTEFYIVETDKRTVLSLKTCKQLNLIKVMHSVKIGDEVSGCHVAK